MNSRSFSLKPFPSGGVRQDGKISCTVGRHGDVLSITYTLLGLPGELEIPSAAHNPSRRDALWEKTCLEFFLAAGNSDLYWEFNLSPAGHWNVYRFTSYRQGMREEPAFESLPFSVHAHSDTLRLSLDIDTHKIVTPGQALRIGISAVIRKRSGETIYWALTHPEPQPDFHHRDSFIIDI
jgi:hypothetical protein